MQERFQGALSFNSFLEEAEERRQLWQRVHQGAVVAPEIQAAGRDLPRPWRLLALAEDWCMDSANTVPWVARLADSLEALELRILRKDANPELMQDHLTDGGEAIPVLLFLDEEGRERGWWGPRPLELRAFFQEELAELSEEERFAGLRAWYARDRGRSALVEILTRLASLG